MMMNDSLEGEVIGRWEKRAKDKRYKIPSKGNLKISSVGISTRCGGSV